MKAERTFSERFLAVAMAIVMVVSMFPSQATASIADDAYRNGQPIIYPGMMSADDGDHPVADIFDRINGKAGNSESNTAGSSGSAASGLGNSKQGQMFAASSPSGSAVQNSGPVIMLPGDSSFEPASIQRVKVQYESSGSDQAGDIIIDIPSTDESSRSTPRSSRAWSFRRPHIPMTAA